MAGPVCTTCPYCGVGCGLLVERDSRGTVTVKGDPDHPANFGRLCSKGSALGETVGLEGRLLAPRIGDREASWDEALGLIAARFSDAISEYGPDSVAFYGSGQLLTEDYYVANKLMKGFIGSANIDTNSRLCMASSVAGHKRAFGTDTVPGTYEDLEQAGLVVLVGSNLAWCHPVLYQRLVAAKSVRPGMRVVNIDPRRTATCDLADLHLPLAPGGDVALFNGLLRLIGERGAVDRAYVEAHVSDLDAALEAAGPATLDAVADATDLSRDLVAAFYEMWVSTERVVTVYSQGVNQSSCGTDKVNAILNCHLATGRIGRPGMGPFSVTGQPNAMGGREVGGLANMLAAHLDLENPAHRDAVQAFWQSPTICTSPGLKAVDLFRACAEGRIKALWILSTNPAVSLPDAEAVRAAIETCPFVVVSDMTAETDTARLADVLLPAAGWGEKSGTVTNSERRISRQRAFLPVPGEARADWRALCDVAARMGWGEAFDYDGPAAIFREHAALSAVAVRHGRDFDIAALSELGDAAYDDMPPVQWPVAGEARFFGSGGFYTGDRKARAVPVSPQPGAAMADAYPFRLNTGRVRDHWHTMTRTARSARLSQHIAEPFVEIHPRDAAACGIADADLVSIETPQGQAIVRALLTDRVRRGDLFAPMHWTGEWAPTGRIGAAVAPVTDPVSGQPDLKGAAARVTRFAAGWYAFVASASEIRPQTAYWARARTRDGWRVEIADLEQPDDWETFARALFAPEDGEIVSMIDRGRGIARVALVCEGRVRAVLFADRKPVEVARTHVINALGGEEVGGGVLAGRPGAAQPDPGPTVCSCFDVGANTILAAIASQNLTDVDQLGRTLNAGTNCGSCRPELRALLEASGQRMAAE